MFKMTANNTFLLGPDLNIVITEIIIPAKKIIGDSINVKSIRFSE